MSETQHTEAFGSYVRRCGAVFLAVVCGTLVMVGTSYAQLSNQYLAIGIILAGAVFNAFMVAAYLMHLVTEKRMIYGVLIFTAFFFVMLMGLSVWASHDVPAIMAPPLK